MIISVANRLKITNEYYFSVKLQEVKSMMDQGIDVINIAIGNPDMAPSASTIKTLQDEAGKTGNHGYQPYRSIPQLREAISKWYNHTYHVSLNSNTEILPLIGSKEGIAHISLAFLNEGDSVLVPELGYPAYRAVTEMLGGKTITYPMVEHEGWRPDFEAMKKQDLSAIKLMWINYPNMPTGAPASSEIFEKLVEFAHKHKILLCHDNPYSLVLNEGDPLSLLSIDGAKEVAIELNSMSKSHNMAGWRIGWISGDSSYIDAILKIKSNVDSGMFKPMQLAAATALSNPESWHKERNQIYKKRRTLVYQILDHLQCSYSTNQVGMFIWAQIPAHVPSGELLIEYLLHKHHIFVAPGFIFGEKGDRYIRISLCIDEQIIREVVDRVKNIDLTNI